jgi:hypothetical protein
MHLHALEGAWIDHPFWKTRFVLADPADLRKLRDSGVPESGSTPARGWTWPSPSPAAPAAGAGAAAAGAAAAQRRRRRPPAFDGRRTAPGRRHLQPRLAAVMSMFREARLGQAVDAEGCLPLVEEISESVLRNPGAMVSLARLKTQDEYSYMHSWRCAR